MFKLLLSADTLVFRATRLLSGVCLSGGRGGEVGGEGEGGGKMEVEVKGGLGGGRDGGGGGWEVMQSFPDPI